MNAPDIAKKYYALPAGKPFLPLNGFQGLSACQEEKITLPGTHTDVSKFICVTAQNPRPSTGILTCFPFDRRPN